MATTRELTFIHFSDTHITAPTSKPFMGLNTYQRAREALEVVKASGAKPAFFIISGDLCHEGVEADYEQLKTFVDDIRAVYPVPVLLALGNHDHRVPFRKVMLGEANPSEDNAYYYSETVDGLRVLVLDSKAPGGEHHGELDEVQLTWLAAQFVQDAVTDTLIVVHHPAMKTGMAVLDMHLLRSMDRLAEVLAGNPIVGILSGHVHMNFIGTLNGAPSVAGTGIGFTLDPMAPQGTMTLLDGSGFNVVRLVDGNLTVTNVPMQRSGHVLVSATLEQMAQMAARSEAH